ncbi:ribosomal protein L24e-domain-containing protein [Mycotypha africana]|uniref:ribosomal protein L24e-domain-containing protein n=1 Tax=Mycotypha africana TaxID=64632 RepID=UPI0023001069|nr:ribosomal protein L24e-domain-containing protein [Mycotypha africana]KAI8975575.1 ribosomal protein L24e-domain-containing protein [Mycotypha africana]
MLLPQQVLCTVFSQYVQTYSGSASGYKRLIIACSESTFSFSSHKHPFLTMKLEICSFSGYKIYPAKGKTYVRLDSRTFRFINGKAASYFLQRLNPRKIRWTQIYRRLNKKGMTEEVQKKRSRRTVKHERAIVGASWDAIRAKRNQKPDARAAARQAAISKSKEAKKAAVAAKKAANPNPSQPKVSKQQAKGFAPKAAATSR